jgi:hypothetical protein
MKCTVIIGEKDELYYPETTLLIQYTLKSLGIIFIPQTDHVINVHEKDNTTEPRNHLAISIGIIFTLVSPTGT